jgi:hypothetical protein
MDALLGYGSSSDSEADQSRGFDSAPPLQSTQQAQGALPQPSHDAQPPKPASSGLKLPSASELFGSPSSQALKTTPVGLRAAGGAVQKRQQPGGLRAGQPQQPKVQQLAAGVRAKRGGSGALVPPQLRGRANVVTEDLDRLFTRKAQSPQQGATAAAAPAQQQ